jgi:uroporphyrinogen decarboxylase
MTNPLLRALAGEPQAVPPIWCMRQAGRYQRAYRALRRRHSFETLCREPALAATVALSSIADFDFDAAILFSDLLFPLDALGLGLSYDDNGPHLARPITVERLRRFQRHGAPIDALAFQAEAVALTRQALPLDKGLIGFVGGPWTLFVYAVEGSHQGTLAAAKTSMPLYRAFARVVRPLLAAMARAQLAAGADFVMVFDTAAGELPPSIFHRDVEPDLRWLAHQAPGKLGYFARGLHPAHLSAPTGQGPRARRRAGAGTAAPWAGLGLDWRWDLASALAAPGRRGFVQGNFDPALLRLTGSPLRQALDDFLAPLSALTLRQRRGWICGLGHGVLPDTPEASVRTFVRTVRKHLS